MAWFEVKKMPVHIERVTRRYPNEDTFEVHVRSSIGDLIDFRVVATDEINAYVRAQEIMEAKRVMSRHITWALTVVVLGAFVAMGYGCSLPNMAEVCIAKGKTYVEVDGVDGKEQDVTSCK